MNYTYHTNNSNVENFSICVLLQVSTDDSDSYYSETEEDDSRHHTPSHSMSPAPCSRDDHSWKRAGIGLKFSVHGWEIWSFGIIWEKGSGSLIS